MDSSEDLITLCSADHHDVLVRGLWDQFQYKCGVDFDLGLGVWAHQFVLDVFLSRDRLILGDAERLLTKGGLNSLLEFLYTGRVTVHTDQLANMMETAEDCGFQLLVDAITDATCNNGAGSYPPASIDSAKPSPSGQQSAGVQRRVKKAPGKLQVKSEPMSEEEEEVDELPIKPEVNLLEGCPKEAGGSDYDNLPPVGNRRKRKLSQPKTSGMEQKDDKDRPYRCGMCGKTFLKRRNLNIHSRTHTGERPYPCGVCGQAFAHKSNRNEHERLHESVKPHVCPECGRAFVRLTQLESHFRTHISEKPFICDICGKVFTSLKSLTRHVRSHTGERPFTCFCGVSFTRHDNLNAHARLHHSRGEEPTIKPAVDLSIAQAVDVSISPAIDLSISPAIDVSISPAIDLSISPVIDLSVLPSSDHSILP